MNSPTPIQGGQERESVDDASRRSPERLRHKGRAVSIWDYERMALEKFPTITRVAVVCGVAGSLVLIGWMLTDLKGPRSLPGQEPVLSLTTNTATAAPISPTAEPEPLAVPDSASSTPTSSPRPTVTATATPQPIDVNFNADSYSLLLGECTTLRWSVAGATKVFVLGSEVKHVEAEQVCPQQSTTYRLIAQNQVEQFEDSFTVEVLVPSETPQPLGCTGYDGNGQLVCKTTCGPNDPGDECELK